MRLPTYRTIPLLLCALLAACGTGQPGSVAGVPGSTGSESTRQRAANGLLPYTGSDLLSFAKRTTHAAEVGLYLTQEFGGHLLGYSGSSNANPICSRNGLNFPYSISADAKGNLYVISTRSLKIEVFGPNCGAEIGHINDEYGIPRQVAVVGSTLYIGNNEGQATKEDKANILVCTLPKCSAPRVLLSPGVPVFQYISSISGVAVDPKGNVYASGNGSPPRQLGSQVLIVWAKGKMPGKVVHPVARFMYKQGLGTGPLEFDNSGNLVTQDTNNGIWVYSGCPATCTPHGPFALQNYGPQGFKLNKDNSEIFVADQGTGSVDVYAYHGTAGITFLYSITDEISTNSPNLPFGIAVIPPANL